MAFYDLNVLWLAPLAPTAAKPTKNGKGKDAHTGLHALSNADQIQVKSNVDMLMHRNSHFLFCMSEFHHFLTSRM